MQTEVPKDVQKALKKSLWKARRRRVWEFFCSNCKQARRISIPRQPFSVGAVSQLILATAFFMLVTWPLWTWKGMVILIPLAAVYEVAYRLRVRGLLECPHCGFDPYLYTTDVKAARKEIESFWRKKFDEKGVPFPDKNPPTDTRSPTAEAEAEADLGN